MVEIYIRIYCCICRENYGHVNFLREYSDVLLICCTFFFNIDLLVLKVHLNVPCFLDMVRSMVNH